MMPLRTAATCWRFFAPMGLGATGGCNERGETLLIGTRMLRLNFVLILVGLLVFSACNEGVSVCLAADNPGGVDALMKILWAKGVLTDDEMAKFRASFGKSGATPAEMGSLIEMLKGKGVLSEGEAKAFYDAYGVKPGGGEGGSGSVKLIPEGKDEDYIKAISKEIKDDVQEEVKSQIKDDMLKEAKAGKWSPGLPDWAQRVRFGGDIRVRYQGEYFDKDNADLLDPSDPTKLLNTKNNRNRALVRVRLGVKAEVNDQVETGVRITTGNESNPVTANDALATYESKSNLLLDQAYVKYTPLKNVGRVNELNVTVGRMANPWLYSDLVWDNDLSFDGLAASGNVKLLDGGRLNVFATAGIFSLEEVEFSNDDKWLYGGQLGIEGKPVDGLSGKVAAAYYGYKNITGKANTLSDTDGHDYTMPAYQQKGNTLFDIDPTSGISTALASEFSELNIIAMLDIGFWHPIHIMLLGDYVKNLGFDKADVIARTGDSDASEETTGYQVGISVGHPQIEKRWDWKTFFYYKRLEADAVVDAFTDSDFHNGGSNAKGWIIGGELGLMKNVWLAVRWLTSDEISGPSLAVDVLQVDLNTRF